MHNVTFTHLGHKLPKNLLRLRAAAFARPPNERNAAHKAASRRLGRQNPVPGTDRRGRHARSRAGRAVRQRSALGRAEESLGGKPGF